MIKASDIAYVRFRAPDLDKMVAYLLNFGMIRSARTDTALDICAQYKTPTATPLR